jgi:imidazolonepropionase-like amidohydrolase
VAARYLGWGARVGSLRLGRYADLVSVRGDPLADIGVLEHVEIVVEDGRVVSR